MIQAILSIIAGIAKAIPSLFKWKIHNERKKAEKDFEADIKKIDKDVHGGDAGSVARHIKRLLGK